MQTTMTLDQEALLVVKSSLEMKRVDGSRLEFTKQLPTERRQFRLHYMDATKI